MSTVNCPNCKTQNTEGSRFCNRCGTPLPRSTHVICPNCQSRNPRNLLYCDNCGTRLSVTGELSSERGEEKEPVPSERPPRAFSLPVREPGDELDANRLLDWLRTGEEQPEGKAGQDAPAEQTAAAEQAAVLDDWLSELSDVGAAGDEDEAVADWFQDASPTVPDDGTAQFADWLLESEESLSEEGGLIDWLADLETDDEDEDTAGFDPQATDTLIAPSPFDRSEEAVPEWLGDFEDSEEDDQEGEALPDWLSGYDSGVEEPEAAEASEEEALPDWLTSYEVGGEEASPAETAEEALPDWLSDYEPEAGQAEAAGAAAGAAEEEILPDWLSDYEPEVGQVEASGAAEAEILPDWLNDFEAAEGTPTLIGAFEQPDETEAAEEGESFDWLDDFGGEEEETPTLISSLEQPSGEDALLDWLNDFDSEEDASTPAAMAEDDLPAWLSDLDDNEESTSQGGFTGLLDEAFGEAPEEEETAPGTGFTSLLDEAFGEAPEEEETAPGTGFTSLLDEAFGEGEQDDVGSVMPDWLADMPSQEADFETTTEGEEAETADILAGFGTGSLTPVDELPDWLADLAPVEEPAPEETAETADEELSDWLSDLPEEEEETSEDTDWLAALTHEEIWPEVSEEEEIVAQLDELEEEDPDESAGHSKELKGVPKELASSGLPDWLQDDMPEFVYEGEEEGEGLLEGELVQETLPDWLQQMKPADLGETASDSDLEADFALAETRDEWQNILENMPPASPESTAGGAALSAAEIPAWLQALRPRDFGEETDDVLETDEPPETEGPLAGMRGVLPIAPAVVKPVAAAGPARFTISKEQQQQISLLHQLTHEEPVKTTQVAHQKAAAFSPVWRVVLGLFLFLVVVAGVLLPRLGIGLPETALPVPASAFDAFNTIDAVSGRTVLVAFEYTPAMAGELDPIALMLLRHLAENDNRVLTISQSAAGTAIAEQITAEVSNLESSAFGLLPGEAVGLRSLGSCLNSADDCGLLLGTEPDAALQGELADIGLVLILTSDRNSLVNWIEQVENQKDVPVIAAVSQPLGPLTIPYLSSDQLEGSLDGIPAASAYEKRLRGEEAGAFEAFSAQTVVMWVVIVALAAAALFYGLTGFVGRGRKKGSG